MDPPQISAALTNFVKFNYHLASGLAAAEAGSVGGRGEWHALSDPRLFSYGRHVVSAVVFYFSSFFSQGPKCELVGGQYLLEVYFISYSVVFLFTSN